MECQQFATSKLCEIIYHLVNYCWVTRFAQSSFWWVYVPSTVQTTSSRTRQERSMSSRSRRWQTLGWKVWSSLWQHHTSGSLLGPWKLPPLSAIFVDIVMNKNDEIMNRNIMDKKEGGKRRNSGMNKNNT